MIEFITTYWDSILVVAVCIGIVAFLLIRGEKGIIDKIIYRIVTEAEKEYGSGTGSLKLAAAIDAIYPRLPAVIRMFVTANTLKTWIENGLTAAKKTWETNPAIQEYIKK